MNKAMVVLIAIVFCACGSNEYKYNPITFQIPKHDVVKEKPQFAVEVERDEFKDTTWHVASECPRESGDPIILLRALEKKGELVFIQIYADISAADWGFYRKAIWADGQPAALAAIDSEVWMGYHTAGGVREIVGVEVPLSRLEQGAKEGLRVSIRGRGRIDLALPADYVARFLKYLRARVLRKEENK